MAYVAFTKDEFVLVTRSGSNLSKQSEITPKELLKVPLVLREQGSGTLDVVFKALAQVKINPKDLNVETTFQNSSSIKQYLAHSETAAFLSIQSVLKELKYNELTVIEIKNLDIFRTFQFIQLRGNSSKLIELFKRFCKTHNLKL